MCQGYDGPKHLLGKAEQFFLAVAGVPRYQIRTKCMLVRVTFGEKYGECEEKIQTVQRAVKQLRQSKAFKQAPATAPLERATRPLDRAGTAARPAFDRTHGVLGCTPRPHRARPQPSPAQPSPAAHRARRPALTRRSSGVRQLIPNPNPTQVLEYALACGNHP